MTMTFTPPGTPPCTSFKSASMRTTMLGGISVILSLAASPALALVTPDNVTPASVVDTTNTRPYFVGLAITNEAGNGGGTCTGMLINPRTVLFAAHCVDGLAPGAYDGNAPGNRARVGYTTDPRFGTANLRNFLFAPDFGTQPGSDGRTMVNSSFVWYDPRSRFGSQAIANNGTFLPADIAIAGFDTPTELLGRDAADGIGLLFSPITGTVAVSIGGYGQSGNGLTGARTAAGLAEAFQRRLGKNIVSFLGSERDIALGVYGSVIANILEPSTAIYQDLYWADFDDPLKRPFSVGPGVVANTTLDFDVFPGDAVAGEAITAAGDSGSPLITAAFGREVSLGVLSQGNRFFHDSLGNPNDNLVRNTAFSNFGTTAGYNPLFLFWDQILINNPYKYVTVAAGDGEWTDATRWRQELDPLYFTLSGTTLVNGLPTTAALGVSDAAANVGTIRPNPVNPAACAFTGTCPTTGGRSDPVIADKTTEVGRVNLVEGGDEAGTPAPTTISRPGVFAGDATSGNLFVSRAALPGVETLHMGATPVVTQAGTTNSGAPEAGTGGQSAQKVVLETNEASSTLAWTAGRIAPNSGALTGVGSTGFVANNVIGQAGIQNSTRWFEVNLRGAGTTFVTNTNVIIDRLNVRGSTAGLNIRSNGSLTTLLSSFVDAGMVTVDGTLTSRMLAVSGGMIGGNGTINARDGLMVSGGIVSPGTLGGGVGRLSVNGSTTFTGAGMYGVDLGSATAADFLAVTGNLVLGGTLAVNATNYVPAFGTTWTVANASGGVTGAFNTFASNLPGVLRPEALVSGNNLQIRITALPFDTFLRGRATDEQVSVGAALNQVRSVAGMTSAADLFAGIDRLDAASLGAALETLKPTNALAVNQNVRLDNMVAATSIFDRLAATRAAPRGTMSVSLVGANLMPSRGLSANGGLMASLLGNSEQAAAAASAVSIAPEWSVFAAATYGYGTSDIQSNSTSEPNAWTFTLGADRRVSDQVILGLGASYQAGDAGLSLVGNSIESEGYSLNAYAALDLTEKTKLDTFIRYGMGTLDTTRLQALGNTTFTSAGQADTSSLVWGTTFSHDLKTKGSLTWTPVITLLASKTTIDAYTENTGSTALAIDKREIGSLQIKPGLQVAGQWSTGGAKVRPYGRLSAVFETDDSADAITARFVSGGANAVPFKIVGVERTGSFGEVAGGFSFAGSENFTLSMEANQSFGRDELELGSVTVTGRLRF